MLRFEEEGEDAFFDARDNIRTSISSSSSEECDIGKPELELKQFDHGLWTVELISVQERRRRFFQGMGFDECVTAAFSYSHDHQETTGDKPSEAMEFERIASGRSASVDTSSLDDELAIDFRRCIKDLDSGKRFIVHDEGQDGLFSILKEVGSNKVLTLQEFDTLLGPSSSVQKLLSRALVHGEEKDSGFGAKNKKLKSWWRRPEVGLCKYGFPVSTTKMNRSISGRVRQQRKKCMEFAALFLDQEIQAHKGLITTLKFSPSGWYMATGGEDCIVRIWQVREVEASCRSFSAEISDKFVDRVNNFKLKLGKGSAQVVIPQKVFKIEDTALHEFHGHTSDILDLSWSTSDCLLTSSKDKTVRLWKVGYKNCLKIFQHNDYVTCVQFNPIDEGYFITGSIDGKVRVWGALENRVIEWADIRDMVTAVCYQPDGKGFAVGSITGICRFYDYSGQNMQLDTTLCVYGKKKSSGSHITGLQFSPFGAQSIMITSGDSRIRIFDGIDVVQKFRGLRKANSLFSASFMLDGRYLVSVGDDSHVYIWNSDGSRKPSKRAKSTSSCELFFSGGASVAAPWPGVDRGARLSTGHLDPPLSQRILDPSTLLRDPYCYSLGTRLFSDGFTRGYATWPEEKLPSPLADNYHHHYRHLTSISAAWNTVIVTASNDGVIRSFHNYGLPVRT
ncbi:uncharacterized protein [Typha angustifolia]|uniref:uncharacterized protein n=1 Tax=Typha angustifolia TaxID=59011 RepID=UPI003C30E93F